MSNTARGRPAKSFPVVQDTSVASVRRMAKEYEGAKLRRTRTLKKRRSLMRIMEVDISDYEAHGIIRYNREREKMIPECDQKALKQFEHDMVVVWVLEHGIRAIADDRIREIAEDTLLKGMKIEALKSKYDLKRAYLYRLKKMAVVEVASFLESVEAAGISVDF